MRCTYLVVMWTFLMLLAPNGQAAILDGDQVATLRDWLKEPADQRVATESLDLPEKLTRGEAEAAAAEIWNLIKEASQASASPLGELPEIVGPPTKEGRLKLRTGGLELGKYKMPFVVLRREAATGVDLKQQPGRPLFLCLHGGGQMAQAPGPHAWPVNTREWQAQVGLSLQVYPDTGVYWIPRMADDRLGRWWHKHNQQAIDQVIDHAITHWGVDPNRVYLLGISEGGYGTDILAPFMPDRFAGAAAMAAGVGLGNPPENLRNLAFRSEVGAEDNMFDRKKLAVAYHQRLDELHAADPQGYPHELNLQANRGHGIDYAPGPAWIAGHRRQPFPDKLVWIDKPLHGERRDRFYWLNVDSADREGRCRFVVQANRERHRIEVTAEQLNGEGDQAFATHAGQGTVEQVVPLQNIDVSLLLSDELLDLDNDFTVELNGQQYLVEANRSCRAILRSLVDRPDPAAVATQWVTVPAKPAATDNEVTNPVVP
ncbi:hypothetical protein N9N28_14995 [Rubripirellula amarantea]|nr:hypothetical protein [Rubripirellula amarantea]